MRSVHLLSCLLLMCISTVCAQEAPFQDEIRAFMKQDSLKRPPQHAILFVGSSSFRKWTDVQEAFPGHQIINRGFGGSTLPDVIRYADKIIYPYQPKQVVIYCGENDVASNDSVSARMVYDRFRILFYLVRDHLPAVPIVFISLKPSPSRVHLLPTMREANQYIRSFLQTQPATAFVDVYSLMLNPDGSVMKDIFIEDDLHMNAKGYQLWQKAIKPFLLKD